MDYRTKSYVAFFAVALTDLKSQKGLDEVNYILNELKVYPEEITSISNQCSDPTQFKDMAYQAIRQLSEGDKSIVRTLFTHAYMNGGKQSDLHAVSIFKELIMECDLANAII